MKTCSVPACGKVHYGLGLCSAHYTSFKRYGYPIPDRPPPETKVCPVEGCGRKQCAKGYCMMHYRRVKKHGDPHQPRPRPWITPEGLKICSKCKVPKSPECFYKNPNTNNMCSWCRECRTRRGQSLEQRLYNARHYYGLLPEDWKAMFEKQGEACAICKQPETCKSKRLAVDHDHETGKIRGLLCGNCNTALGLLKESPAIAQAATDYLKSQALKGC